MVIQITYRLATTPHDFNTAKVLFEEYALSLAIDLSFQGFSKELENIAQQYHEPSGGLILALADTISVGCVGVRALDDGCAELKRMFVRDRFRDQKVGVRLLEQAITLAKTLGYQKLRLDTLQEMTRARQLYRLFDFKEIQPYRFNPLEGAIFMEKDLTI